MGDNNRAMKFIEHCIEFKTDNPSELLKSVIVLTLTAPYRLVTEISSKIIFLGKDKIQKVLLYAIGIACSILVAMLLGRQVMKETSWFTGRFPPVMVATAIVLLIILYFVFSSFNFVIYDQLDLLFSKTLSNSDSSESEEEIIEEVTTEAGVEESDDISAFMANTEEAMDGESAVEAVEQSAVVDEKPEEIVDNPALKQVNKDYNYHYSDIVSTLRNSSSAYNGFMSSEDVQELSDSLNDVIDPSKYISEELISKFLSEVDSIAANNVEDLDLTIIPSGFRCVS